MPNIEDVAEQIAGLYWRLMAREDVPESTLDRLFDAVTELDTAGGGLEAQAVRRMLDGLERDAMQPLRSTQQ